MKTTRGFLLNICVESYKDFIKGLGPKVLKSNAPKSRDTKSFDIQPHTRKSTNFVPVYRQVKADNVKYVKVKDGASQSEILNDKDIQDLGNKFTFDLDTVNRCKPVKLGNTGLSLSKQNNRYILSR